MGRDAVPVPWDGIPCALRPWGHAGIRPGSFLVLQDSPCPEQSLPNPSAPALEGFEGKAFTPELWRCSPGVSKAQFSSSELVLGKALGKLVWIIAQVVSDTFNEGSLGKKCKAGRAGTPGFLLPAEKGLGGSQEPPHGLWLHREQQPLLPLHPGASFPADPAGKVPGAFPCI